MLRRLPLSSEICAASLSSLGVIYATGEIPFKEKPEAPVENKKDGPVNSDFLGIFASSDEAIEKLVKDLNAEKKLYKEN